MAWSSVLGIAALILLVGFIVFAFRKGDKVHKSPQGTPTDKSGGYTP